MQISSLLNMVSQYTFMEVADMYIMSSCACVHEIVLPPDKNIFLTYEIPGLGLGVGVLFCLTVLSVASMIQCHG